MCGVDSVWTVITSAPALANASTSRSGRSTMRWQSRSPPRSWTSSRNASTISDPIVIGGTKCPSMTSTWITRAPASITVTTCCSSRAKLLARSDGAISPFGIGRGSLTAVRAKSVPDVSRCRTPTTELQQSYAEARKRLETSGRRTVLSGHGPVSDASNRSATADPRRQPARLRRALRRERAHVLEEELDRRARRHGRRVQRVPLPPGQAALHPQLGERSAGELLLDRDARLQRHPEPEPHRLLDRAVRAERQRLGVQVVLGEELGQKLPRTGARLALEPDAVAELARRHGPAAHEGVGRGGDQRQLVAEEREPGDAGVLRRPAGDGDVDLVLEHALEDRRPVRDLER